MKQPNITTTFIDQANNVTYNVVAFRKITAQEMAVAIYSYHAQHRKKLKKGTTVTIVSIIGHDRF